jgi:hypothetical protein
MENPMSVRSKVTVRGKVVTNAPSLTACSAGAFDTAARLDAQAALIRNQTWIATPGRVADGDYSGAPDTPHPE